MLAVPDGGAVQATAAPVHRSPETPAVPAPRRAPAEERAAVGWGVDRARLALAAAAAGLGLDAGAAVLVRDVSTVVFRVGGTAVKVQPPSADPERHRRVLAALGGTTTTLHPLAGPVATPHGLVTVWPWCGPHGGGAAPVTWPEIGGLLRRFHAETGGVDLAGLPPWRPLSRLAEQVAGLPEPLAAVLLDARDRLRTAAAGLRSDLGRGLVHGDVSAENVLRSGGRPVLIDLDFVAVGPREYDLVGAYLRRRAGELSTSAYRRFCAAYGADVRDWAGLPLVTDICELGALTFGIWAARHAGTELPGLAGRVARWA